MTPVDQEFVHAPERGQQGDCMRACVASLLDLPIADVPHFAQIDADGGENFWTGVASFIRSHGFAFVMMKGRIVWADEAIYHIISGSSPRSPRGHHAIVGLNGQVHFDPHPSRAGLAGDSTEWTFYLFVRPNGGA